MLRPMSGATRYPSNERPVGQPLPLHLPLDDVPYHDPRQQRNRDRRRDDSGERDLPGSHVIVIDLA